MDEMDELHECRGHATLEECKRHEGFCDGHEYSPWCDCGVE